MADDWGEPLVAKSGGDWGEPLVGAKSAAATEGFPQPGPSGWKPTPEPGVLSRVGSALAAPWQAPLGPGPAIMGPLTAGGGPLAAFNNSVVGGGGKILDAAGRVVQSAINVPGAIVGGDKAQRDITGMLETAGLVAGPATGLGRPGMLTDPISAALKTAGKPVVAAIAPAKATLNAVRGAGTKAAQTALADSVRDGTLVEDLISGKTAATEAEIARLKDVGDAATKAQLAFVDSIKNGTLVEDLISGKTAATQADIDRLRVSGAMTERQAADAINALETAHAGDTVRLRAVRDSAAAEHGAVADTLRQAPPTEQTGGNLRGMVEVNLAKLRGNRRSVGEALYDKFHETAEAKMATGDTFQKSPAGVQFKKDIDELLSTTDQTKLPQDERRFLENVVLPDVYGVRTAGREERLSGFDEQGNPIIEPAAEGKTAPSNSYVLQGAVRRLRDIENGHPEEGYAAIRQQFARNMAERLTTAIKGWEPSLAEADSAYRDLSETLRPFQTALGKRAAKGEDFDYQQLMLDPSNVPGMFFKTPQSVRSLITLTGGRTAEVNQAAEQYAMRELAGKTPAQARKWLDDAEWLSATPAAGVRLKRLVDRYETAGQRLEAGEAAIGERVKAHAVAVKERESAAAGAQDQTAAGIAKAKAAQTAFEQKFNAFKTGVQTGVITPEDAIGQARTLLKGHIDDIPRPVLEKAAREITEIESQQATAKAATADIKRLETQLPAFQKPLMDLRAKLQTGDLTVKPAEAVKTVRDFVNKNYADIPEDVRARIGEELKNIEAIEDKEAARRRLFKLVGIGGGLFEGGNLLWHSIFGGR